MSKEIINISIFNKDKGYWKWNDNNDYILNIRTGESFYLRNSGAVENLVDLLNEQQEKITELEIELTDCKNRKEQLEYKNTKLIAKIDFLERVIDGDV